MCLITSFVIKFYSAKVIGRLFSFFVSGSGSGSCGEEAEAVDGLVASTSLFSNMPLKKDQCEHAVRKRPMNATRSDCGRITSKTRRAHNKHP